MKRILLNGAFGRMGAELQKIIKQQKNQVLTVDPKGRGDFESFKQIKKQKVYAVIDFSSEEGMSAALDWCVESKTPFVSGTTGISAKAHANLRKASTKTPVLWAPNMSLGVHVLRKCIQQLRALDEGFDFQIEDIHHKHKKDSPSGTAKILQDELKTAVGPKRAKKIPDVISIRAGGVFGVHKVVAYSDEEVLALEHQALNRAVFAKGAVLAAHWLTKQKPGLYKFENIF